MIISSAKVVMELQYWFNKFLFTSELNKNQIPYPSDIRDNYFINDNSFLRLLFDDNWPMEYDSYNYMFENFCLQPDEIIQRICIYPGAAVYRLDKQGTDNSFNFFNLKEDDLLMLDKLLDYRISNSTSILNITIDPNETYETSLANLINCYLDLVINDNYQNFDDTILKSNDLLSNLYELYVIEKMFQYVSGLDI